MDFWTVAPVVLGVILTGVIGVVAWLVRTVSKIPELATKEELNAHREKVAENYVRREDYVPQLTQMTIKLDAIGQMVARLDERSKETL